MDAKAHVEETKGGVKFPSAANPAKVSVGFKLVNVSGIDSVNETFNAQIRFILQWNDPNLVGFPTDNPEWEQRAWDPKFYVANVVGEVEELEVAKSFRNSSTGEMKIALEIRGQFSSPFKLQRFPFDTQVLPFILRSGAKKMRHDALGFDIDNTRQTILSTVTFSEWKLLPPAIYTRLTDPSQSSKGYLYQEAIICLGVRRLYAFYFWNMVLPIFLIVSMGLAAFGVPLDDLGGRLGIVITLVLTAVAFKFVAADNIPRISYLTWMDKYILANFLFLYLIGMENWLITYVSERDSDLAKDMDDVIRNVAIALYFGYHVLWALYELVRESFCKREDPYHDILAKKQSSVEPSSPTMPDD